jgi:glutathione S-transferase
MLVLGGSPISSYYNKVKLALLEKDVGFREELCGPSQDESFLKYSPMGKIPYLRLGEYEDFLTESTVIIEYLEMAYPRKMKLYPGSVVAASNCRQLISYFDNYVVNVGQELVGMFLFNLPKDEAKIKDVLSRIERGIDGVRQLVRIEPFLLGGQYTAADVTAIPAIVFIESLFAWAGRDNPFQKIDGFGDYWNMMQQRPMVKKVLLERQEAIEAMIAAE